MPEIIEEEPPELGPGLELMHRAFIDLDTERHSFDEMIGPIPWSSVEMYADSLGIVGYDRLYFHEVLSRLDNLHIGDFLRRRKEQREKLAKSRPVAKLRARKN